MSPIYPEIRRASEPYEKISGGLVVLPLGKHQHHPNNLEKNCNQIFVKAPALTKDFLDKMQQDIAPGRTRIFGYEMKTRNFWFLTGLFILFFTSFTGAVVMWFTSLFDKAIFANLVLTVGSQAFQNWIQVSPKPLLKFHIFNYTNVLQYEAKLDEKLHVQEIGPYVYEEHLERVNTKFLEDGTISYQERRSYKFRSDLSKGRQSDRVIVPNVPLLSGAALNKHATFFQRMAFNGLLKTLSQTSFLNMAAHRFITGYDDDLYDISKSFLKLQNEKPVDRFGLITTKSGLQSDVLTIDTGENSINNLAMIKTINGEDQLHYWSTDECNSYGGTDGTMFPPKLIREKRRIYTYMKDMCRALPLDFDKEVTILDGKIPAYRYILPLDTFDTPESNPTNQCYCNLESGDCPLQGVFNATPCSMGAPIFFSFPHFFNADPSLKLGVTGLNLDITKEEVQSFGNFHPSLGFAMSGATKVQANVQVQKSYGISQLNMLEDGQMLPLAWMEFSLSDKDLPDDFISIIYQTTFTIKGVELGLKYGCLLSAIVTFICGMIVLNGRWQTRHRTSSMRPLQRRHHSTSIEE